MRRHPNRKSTSYNKSFIVAIIADALEEKDRRDSKNSRKINAVLKTNSKDILKLMGYLGISLAIIGPLYWFLVLFKFIDFPPNWQSLAFSSAILLALGGALSKFSFKLAFAIDVTNDVHLQTNLFSAVLSFIALIVAIVSFFLSGSRLI